MAKSYFETKCKRRAHTKKNTLIIITYDDRIKTALSILVNLNKIRSSTHPKEARPQQYIFKMQTLKIQKKYYYSIVFYCKEYIHQDQSLCTNYHCTYPQKNKPNQTEGRKKNTRKNNKKRKHIKTICTFRVPIDYVIFVLYCWPARKNFKISPPQKIFKRFFDRELRAKF